VLAVRVYSYRNAGGVVGPAAEMRLEPAEPGAGAPITLAGRWRYAVEHDFGAITDTSGCPELLPNQNSPYALFENMIAPLVPYALRGFIWYQGESNAAEPQLYRKRFPALIRDWRRAWGGANLPFIFVQLANYVSDGKWPWLREAQTLALAEPATAMAVALDIGDPEDVHPRNKQEVGRRLALAAESLVYGRELVSSGPLYRSHEVKGEVLQVRFNHVGGGLVAKGGGRLLGFAVAGRNKKFVEAEAAIEGDAVLVRAAGVKRPAAVRYAWADNPTCNLCNREGLPASPFRTDEWKGVTAGKQ
jgi:sialate O-acetylesterase